VLAAFANQLEAVLSSLRFERLDVQINVAQLARELHRKGRKKKSDDE